MKAGDAADPKEIGVDEHPWTPEATDRLWEHLSGNPGTQELYFSRKFRSALVSYLSMTGHLVPGVHVLDYGCGPGYLIDGLLEAGALCSGLDRSVEAVGRANARLRDRPQWNGAVVHGDDGNPLPGQSFDLITCIEIVEHLDGPVLFSVLDDILRLLRPGGTAFFATPHAEDLA